MQGPGGEPESDSDRNAGQMVDLRHVTTRSGSLFRRRSVSMRREPGSSDPLDPCSSSGLSITQSRSTSPVSLWSGSSHAPTGRSSPASRTSVHSVLAQTADEISAELPAFSDTNLHVSCARLHVRLRHGDAGCIWRKRPRQRRLVIVARRFKKGGGVARLLPKPATRGSRGRRARPSPRDPPSPCP